MLASLRYTTDDARRESPNHSKIDISGDVHNGLATVRSAIGLYRRFRDEAVTFPSRSANSVSVSAPGPDAERRERLGLERDLQKALRREIGQIEAGLTIIDEGAERAVASGYIDITARDANGATVVIELKAGVADRTAIGQILGYMGDILEEEPASLVRGILVAHNFDSKATAAARMVPGLALRSYSVRFSFGTPASSHLASAFKAS